MPRYEVISQTGPDHEKTFNVVVSISGRPLGSGIGSSKKEAEQKAAAEALDSLREN
jgi:ribonuclease-3